QAAHARSATAKPLYATLARGALLCLDSMAAPHPRPLGILRPELPRLHTARLPRCPLQAILRQVLIIDPSATDGTQAFGINDSGQIVGVYTDGTGSHGFLLVGNNYSTLDDSAGNNTQALGINNAGQILGSFIDGTRQHGFLLSRHVYPTPHYPFG